MKSLHLNALTFLQVVAPLFSLVVPRFQFKGANKRGIPVTRDPVALRAKYADPLVYTGPIRVRTGHEILRISSYLMRNFRSITIPFFVLHGSADRVTDPMASQDLYNEAASEFKDIKLYEGFLHDLLFEPEREEIGRDIIDWMEKKLSMGPQEVSFQWNSSPTVLVSSDHYYTAIGPACRYDTLIFKFHNITRPAIQVIEGFCIQHILGITISCLSERNCSCSRFEQGYVYVRIWGGVCIGGLYVCMNRLDKNPTVVLLVLLIDLWSMLLQSCFASSCQSSHQAYVRT